MWQTPRRHLGLTVAAVQVFVRGETWDGDEAEPLTRAGSRECIGADAALVAGVR
jgi:hypothetical protein